jgi:hypothetical protein
MERGRQAGANWVPPRIFPRLPGFFLAAMKSFASLLLVLLLGAPLLSQAAAAPVDWGKARQLLERERRGEKLAPEEQAFLNQARAARGEPQAPGRARNSVQRPAPERLIPLCDMGAQDRYEGEDGGLYGGGRNTPPEAHRQAAEAQLARIQRLDPTGKAAPDGAVALVSLSMSNATQEFSFFKRVADAAPAKAKHVTIVDCAQGGQAMAEWAPPAAPPWQEAKTRLARAGVTPAQVQAAWIKLANKAPAGSFQEHGAKLEADTLAVLHNARALFPNLRIAYLGSRIWAGNATGGLNPEPYAYESAYIVRRLIQRQMSGDPELAEGRAPLLLWGPYLWAEGTKGRKSDQLVWEEADFNRDGVHPADSGRAKVARLLLDFFSTDPLARSWFTGRR